MKKKYVVIAVIIILVIFALVGRWQFDVGSDCVIEPSYEHSNVIYAQTPGVLISFNFRSGDAIKKDEIIGKLADIELQDSLEQVKATLQENLARKEVLNEQIEEKKQQIVSAKLRKERTQAEYSYYNSGVKTISNGKLPPEIHILKTATEEAERKYKKLYNEQKLMLDKKIFPPSLEAYAQSEKLNKVSAEKQEFIQNKNKYLVSVGAISQLEYKNSMADYNIAKHTYNNSKATLDDFVQNHFYDMLEAKDNYEQANDKYQTELKKYFLTHKQLGFDTKIAKSEVQNTIFEKNTFNAQMKEANEQVKALQQKLAIFKSKEKKLTLVAPIDGIIIEDDIRSKIGKHFTIGEKICEVSGLKKVLINILVNEKDIADIKINQPVRLKVRPFLGKLFKGKVRKISPISKFDEKKKQNFYSVELIIDNPKAELKPGMTGFAKINCGTRPIISIIFREIGHLVRSEYWFF